MYDYKFQQESIRFRKPKRRLRKLFFAILLFFLASGILYVVIGWGLDSLGSGSEGNRDPNIIPLTLPPKGGS